MSECPGCGAQILWAAHHRTSRIMPLVQEPHGLWRIAHGDAILAALNEPPGERYQVHFADCPATIPAEDEVMAAHRLRQLSLFADA